MGSAAGRRGDGNRWQGSEFVDEANAFFHLQQGVDYSVIELEVAPADA